MNVRSLSAILLLSLVLLSIDACTLSAPPRPKAPDSGFRGTTIEAHVWDTLTANSKEQAGYGYYTYVLFPRRTDPETLLPEKTRSRYLKTLKEIISFENVAEGIQRSPESVNIFYVPGNEDYLNTSLTLLANYNTLLAMKYLGLLKQSVTDIDLKNRLGNNDGPFLISTLMPIGKKTGDAVILYADLSQTNTAAIAEVISAYKTHMLNNELSELERFKSLRTFLLNVMLNADDHIKILKVAMAHTLDE